jgi:hypothetical protein
MAESKRNTNYWRSRSQKCNWSNWVISETRYEPLPSVCCHAESVQAALLPVRGRNHGFGHRPRTPF